MGTEQLVSPDKFRELLDACWQARKVTELMPQLPDGLRPRHVTVLDAIHIIGRGRTVRVRDIAAFLRVSDPGVTTMVQDLTALGLVSKHADPTDGRVVNLALTESGRNFRRRYVRDFHGRLRTALAGTVSDADCLVTIRTIGHLFDVLQQDKHRNEA